MEIVQDADLAGFNISRFKGRWKSIEGQLDFFAQHWPTASENNLSGNVTFERPESSVWQLNGLALGKPFCVQASPIVIDEAEGPVLYAEIIVSTPSIVNVGTMIELGRVRLNHHSAIFTTEGTKILGEHDDMASYKLLVSITNLVLRAEVT